MNVPNSESNSVRRCQTSNWFIGYRWPFSGYPSLGSIGSLCWDDFEFLWRNRSQVSQKHFEEVKVLLPLSLSYILSLTVIITRDNIGLVSGEADISVSRGRLSGYRADQGDCSSCVALLLVSAWSSEHHGLLGLSSYPEWVMSLDSGDQVKLWV